MERWWRGFRDAPVWLQVVGWLFIWPVLLGLFVGSRPQLGNAATPAGATTLVLASILWIALLVASATTTEEPVADDARQETVDLTTPDATAFLTAAPTAPPTETPPSTPIATPVPTPAPTSAPTPVPVATAAPTPAARSNCHPSYPDHCIPPPPPDLNCDDVPYRNFRVLHDVADPDPHRFDGNKDGVGCES